MCMLFKIVKLVGQESKGRTQTTEHWEKVVVLQKCTIS